MSETEVKQTTPSGIKVTYKEISSYAFTGAMEKLRAQVFKDGGRCAYLVKKMSQAVEKISDRIRKEYKAEMMEKFAKRDAEGKFNEDSFEVDPEKKEEFKVALEAFEAREAYVERPKFTYEIVRELTAGEQEGLDCILDDSGFESMPAPGKGPAIRRA